MNKFTTLWVAGLAISFLTSCATVKTIQAYEGEVKPEGEVAIVDCDLGIAVTIDGNPKYFLKSGPPGYIRWLRNFLITRGAHSVRYLLSPCRWDCALQI